MKFQILNHNQQKRSVIFLVLTLVFFCFAQPTFSQPKKNNKEVSIDFNSIYFGSLITVLEDFSGYEIEVDKKINLKEVVFINIKETHWKVVLSEIGTELDFDVYFEVDKVRIKASREKINKTGLVTNKIGMFYLGDGSDKPLKMKQGEIHYPSGIHYKGQLKKGMPHGLGRLFSNTSELWMEGDWSKGKLNKSGQIYTLKKHNSQTSGELATMYLNAYDYEKSYRDLLHKKFSTEYKLFELGEYNVLLGRVATQQDIEKANKGITKIYSKYVDQINIKKNATTVFESIFTDDEIKTIIKFYKTKTGEKLLNSQVLIGNKLTKKNASSLLKKQFSQEVKKFIFDEFPPQNIKQTKKNNVDTHRYVMPK